MTPPQMLSSENLNLNCSELEFILPTGVDWLFFTEDKPGKLWAIKADHSQTDQDLVVCTVHGWCGGGRN